MDSLVKPTGTTCTTSEYMYLPVLHTWCLGRYYVLGFSWPSVGVKIHKMGHGPYFVT